MRKSVRHLAGGVLLAIAALAAIAWPGPRVHEGSFDVKNALGVAANMSGIGGLTIEYPLDGTLFPPEIAAPTFRWKDANANCDAWQVTITFGDNREDVSVFTREAQWRPDVGVWDDIKKRCREKQASVLIVGVNQAAPQKGLSAGRIAIKTSADEVGAAIFYREVNLPFVDAVKDPSNIRWRFGEISSVPPPPIILEKLPVCGNCHSFSADAGVLGMDVDYANDKGSYAIVPVGERMVLDKSKIITWSDYKRDEEEISFGLLSQVSPDGRFVVSTVKDESVFVPKPGLEFSQLFFPVKGILCIYDRQSGSFNALPGADDPYLVQSNPSWSPDGKYIVFAATEAYKLKHSGPRKVLLSGDECWEFLEKGKPFKFDLYRIPFNGGRGGKAVPLEGASFNGMSNFFARYSPDGKWIVFCKAENYMLLQPGSQLYIIPAEGGEARKLSANTERMNSWHSFSPNGKWLVFSSKANSAYTQLFLTHIDEEGRSTPPVVLDRFTAPDRAANIPEFVNAGASAIKSIREKFVDDLSFVRAATEFMKAKDFEGVERQARRALELNPDNAEAHNLLGLAFFQSGRLSEAAIQWSHAVSLDPNNVEAQYNLGQVMLRRGRTADAISYFSRVIRLRADHINARVNLGALFLGEGKINEAASHLSEAVRLDPNNIDAHYNLAQAMSRLGKDNEAIRHLSVVVRLRPGDIAAHNALAVALARQQKLDEAVEHWLEVAELDPNNADARYRIGQVKVQQGKLEEAIIQWSEAVRLDGDNAAVRYNLGVALANQEKHDEAIAQWLEFLRLKPDNPSGLVNIAASYAKTGRYDETLVYLEKALKIARSAGNKELIREITKQMDACRQKKPPINSAGRNESR